MFIGVDCGTQGTKVLVCDSNTGHVIGSGYSKHELISNQYGRREQHVTWWTDAFIQAYEQAIKGIDKKQIKGIGISGQQHGMVLLDDTDTPIYPAKLWCDTETITENEEIIEYFGGEQKLIEKIGIMLQTGYTASKILWMQKNHPALFKQIDKILLPHDYLNYWLTGNFVSEFGDTSGTGYLNVHTKSYDKDIFKYIAPTLSIQKNLPRLINAQEIVGKLKPDIADLLGLPADTIVSSGGGDNMMGAIGTGNIQSGIVTMSLGTSGTVYAYTDKPLNSKYDVLANFCSSSNGWLPLICTMNVTSSTSLVQHLFELDIAAFTDALVKSNIGADGVIVLPFFNGERVPSLPDATGSILGLSTDNFTQFNLIRATTEAATFTLKYGLDIFIKEGIRPTEIRLIGGGAKNPVWRQIVADIMNVPVVCPIEPEAAALGGAIQAYWAYAQLSGLSLSLQTICEKWIALDDSTRLQPIAENVNQYAGVYQQYLYYLDKLHS